MCDLNLWFLEICFDGFLNFFGKCEGYLVWDYGVIFFFLFYLFYFGIYNVIVLFYFLGVDLSFLYIIRFFRDELLLL